MFIHYCKVFVLCIKPHSRMGNVIGLIAPSLEGMAGASSPQVFTDSSKLDFRAGFFHLFGRCTLHGGCQEISQHQCSG